MTNFPLESQVSVWCVWLIGDQSMDSVSLPAFEGGFRGNLSFEVDVCIVKLGVDKWHVFLWHFFDLVHHVLWVEPDLDFCS